MQRAIKIGTIVALLAILAYGFTVTGSPQKARAIKQDFATINEMANLHFRLMMFYNHHQKKTLQKLDVDKLNEQPLNGYDCPADAGSMDYEALTPDAIKKYDYTLTSKGYRICAAFNSDWADIKRSHYINEPKLSWASGLKKGKHCFERTLPICKRI